MDILVVIEVVSAILAFVLVWFMARPYRALGDSRYLAFPLGFLLLGFSYIFMGMSMLLIVPSSVERAKWMHLFTGAYAFMFLGVTYHFSSKGPERKVRPFVLGLITLSLLLLVVLVVVLFFPPMLRFPDYKAADEYFRLFNMLIALYIAFYALRSHIADPEPKTIFAPLGYALLAFSQYSLLIWSLDASYSAFVGAHVLRVFSLTVFLYISLAPLPDQTAKDSSEVRQE
jgi:hypothetical protein